VKKKKIAASSIL